MGPEWVRTRQNGLTANSVAGEAVLDFMFWPSAKRRFGWYLEPGYEYNFGRGHEKSVGISFGLLIAIVTMRCATWLLEFGRIHSPYPSPGLC